MAAALERAMAPTPEAAQGAHPEAGYRHGVMEQVGHLLDMAAVHEAVEEAKSKKRAAAAAVVIVYWFSRLSRRKTENRCNIRACCCNKIINDDYFAD